MKKLYQYHIVSEQHAPAGHTLYYLRYESKHGAISEMWVGVTKLRTLYNQGKIIGNLSDQVRYIVGKDKRKERPKKVKLTPRDGSDKPLGFRLPEEWNVPKVEAESLPEAQPELETKPKPIINIKAYCYSDDKGRWHVIQCDGTEDEDTYPDKEWAQREVDRLNNSLK